MKKKFKAPHRETRPAPRPERSKAEGLKTNASAIYGVLPVLEALRAESRRVDKVLIADGAQERRLSEIIDLCRARSIAWSRVPRDNFAKHLDSGVNHQGVLAFTSSAAYVEVESIIDASETPLILILDGVEDPRNLGAILRTAEGADVDGVIIPERRAVGLNDTVAKSSAGAIEYVKVAKAGNLNRLIEDLKARNIWVVGTSMDSTTNYDEWDWTRPSALVLGGEGSGLHRLVAENCDVLVKIPMYGKIDSLNVSVAAGVILFEARRQRSKEE
ncbi:MAG: 23S rRNA (guanosine(2251)-2'-O)-methyltransferase RlmB [Pyrinomonadaceae bacterium]|nr:23S rRNA (guanosine(2251)-2'-O)-methyltransferase RlmB [Pyrinomonadaceae bacterium]